MAAAVHCHSRRLAAMLAALSYALSDSGGLPGYMFQCYDTRDTSLLLYFRLQPKSHLYRSDILPDLYDYHRVACGRQSIHAVLALCGSLDPSHNVHELDL